MNNELFSQTGLPDHPLVRKAWLKLQVYALCAQDSIAYLEWKQKSGYLTGTEQDELRRAQSFNYNALMNAARTLLRHHPDTSPEALASLMVGVTIGSFQDMEKVKVTMGQKVYDLVLSLGNAVLDQDAIARASPDMQLLTMGAMLYYFSHAQNTTAYDPEAHEDVQRNFLMDTKEIRYYMVNIYPEMIQEIDNAFNTTMDHFRHLQKAAKPGSGPTPPAP